MDLVTVILLICAIVAILLIFFFFRRSGRRNPLRIKSLRDLRSPKHIKDHAGHEAADTLLIVQKDGSSLLVDINDPASVVLMVDAMNPNLSDARMMATMEADARMMATMEVDLSEARDESK